MLDISRHVYIKTFVYTIVFIVGIFVCAAQAFAATVYSITSTSAYIDVSNNSYGLWGAGPDLLTGTSYYIYSPGVSLTGLAPNTTYYYVGVNSGASWYDPDTGTWYWPPDQYESVQSFTTLASNPSVTTQAVSNIGSTTATGNGYVTATGGANPSSRIVQWGTVSGSYTSSCDAGAGGVGAYACSMTGLSPNTIYYVRSCAYNTGGWGCGGETSFITSATTPTVTTQAASSITATTATGNGNVTATGGANPTARGIQWGTVSGTYPSSCSAGAGGTGAFSCNLTSLSPSTTYYVRAYANNSAGTGYGTETSFTTKNANDFVIKVKTDNTGTSSNTQFMIPAAGNWYNYNVDCDDNGTIDVTGVTGNYTCTYPTAGTYTIRISGYFPWIYFNNTGDKLKILSIEQWGTGAWESMNLAFYGCSNLVMNATDVPNLSSTTGMYAMFQDATAFNGNISAWNTAAITDMSYMFNGASSFNQNISAWNTTNVVSLAGMFQNAAVFNQDISAWNTAKVTNVSLMFNGASSFNQNISAWNTAAVTAMYATFQNATAFNQNISAWNTAAVTDMSAMFSGALIFDQDISAWNISNVISMASMLTGTAFSQAHYDAALIAWNALSTHRNNVILDSPAQYCAGKNARANLISSYGWAINDAGKNCPVVMPSVTTQAATNISPVQAMLNANLTDDGDDICMRQIEYGTSPENYTQACDAGSSTSGLYACIISGLTPNTTYFYRAKATNAADTAYGSEMQFTTNTAIDATVKGNVKMMGNVKVK